MNDQPTAMPATSPDAAPRQKSSFRSRSATIRMEPAAAERQGRITSLAWKQLGTAGALAFLNSHSDVLNGRPLDLATASSEGYSAVERELAALPRQG